MGKFDGTAVGRVTGWAVGSVVIGAMVGLSIGFASVGMLEGVVVIVTEDMTVGNGVGIGAGTVDGRGEGCQHVPHESLHASNPVLPSSSTFTHLLFEFCETQSQSFEGLPGLYQALSSSHAVGDNDGWAVF